MRKIINLLQNTIFNKATILAVTILAGIVVMTSTVYASTPTDEITDYEITVDVYDDATLYIKYDISWLVLDSDDLGPVSWVQVGIPNSHNIFIQSLSDNIDSISVKNSGGNYAVIYFDRDYYEGERIDFSFAINQDYMYSVDALEDGYTTYAFTPGWFDEIAVDNLTIRWNSDKIYSFSPECLVDGGYNEWTTSLSPGGKYTIKVTYPNDAYAFDLSKQTDDEDGFAYKIGYYVGGILSVACMIVMFMGPFLVIILISKAARSIYDGTSGFGTQTTKKITRTRIEYYPVCQGCGATRPEGTDTCVYCGRSFIKSQEVIKEDQIPENEKDILKHDTNGTYRYIHSPNTYVRVNVVNIPKPRPVTTSRSTSSHHSSCAHSSCACACACACAGGGRAGCTNKDFYNTNLKLSFLEKYRKDNNK